MSEENNDVFGGFNSPASMAESMAKRFNQFHRALPTSSNEELFKLVLDNRYKLMGNTLSVTERWENIRNSEGSLCLLTLNTILSENPDARKALRSDNELLKIVIGDICKIISKESTSYLELDFEELVKKAEALVKIEQ